MNDITRRQLIGAIAAAGVCQSGLGRAVAQTAQPIRAPRFRFDDVIRRARDLASAPFDTTPQLPRRPWQARLRRLARHPFPARTGARRRRRRLLPAADVPSRPSLQPPRDGQHDPGRHPDADPLLGGAVRLRPRTNSKSRLPVNLGFAGFRLHYPVNDPHVLRRGDRLSRRELFPVSRTRSALRPLGARAVRRGGHK